MTSKGPKNPRLETEAILNDSMPPRSPGDGGAKPKLFSLDPRLRDWILRIASVSLFLSIWTFATNSGMVDPTFMPSPQRVLQESQRFINNGELVAAVLASSRRVIVGFFLASAFSVPLGIVLGVWQPAKAFFDPIISLLRPLPSITWIPLTMLWLGIGEVQKYAIVFMGTWIYVLLYTMESTKRVDPILIRAALNLGASKRAIMSEVVLPGSFPGIISGLKVTLAI